VVERLQEALTSEDVVAGLEDPQVERRTRRTVMELAEPGFEVAMLGPEYSSARLDFTGFDGFLAAWRDWTSAFESYRIEVEEMIDAGEMVVSLVAMTGTVAGGVDLSSPGAAVWTVVDGRLRRVEFHLDRQPALRAAGLGGSG